MNTKPLSQADVQKIIPQIKTMSAYAVWHDHKDQTIGNLDLNGEKINVRKNISAMILNTIRAGELLGIDVSPKEDVTVAEYFEKAQKRLRDSIS